MRKLIVFLILSIFCQCQNHYALYKEEKSPTLTSLQKKLDIKGNYINIFFETNFENDKVFISCDDKKVFEKLITTDYLTNLADYYLQKAMCKKLNIRIGTKKIILKNEELKNYKYLYINEKEDNMNLTLSNTPRVYY